ncbi:UNVERIFIED_ORG: hypothetical protein BCL66_12433 [Martelella mediterranea]
MRPISRSALARLFDFEEAENLLRIIEGDRGGQAQQIIPMVENKRRIDGRSDVVFYPGIYIAFFEGVEFPVFYVAEPWCKAFANQGE